MNQKVLEELRLDTAQQKRLSTFSRNLSTNKDANGFDDRLYEALQPYLLNPRDVRSVIGYLDSMRYTARKYDYSQIETQISRFTEANHPKFTWNKNYKSALNSMKGHFAKLDLRQLQYQFDQDIVDAVPRKDTHAGFSFIETGKRKKQEYLEPGIIEVYLRKEEVARQKGSFDNYVLPGRRTQASGAFDDEGNPTGSFKSKSRLVSMVDFYLILAETKFARPVQKALSAEDWYAGGKDDDRIMGRLNLMRRNMPYYISLDYSHYDQSISDWLIRDAFEIMREAFKKDPFFDEQLFEIVREDMIHKYFIDGHMRVRESQKGVGSGSMFTQIVDSIVNRLMILTYAEAFDCELDMMIMGDDNIIYSSKEINIAHLCSYLKHNFGIEANYEKSTFGVSSTHPEFLSRTWRDDGVWREPHLLISKMLYPEHFRRYDALNLDPRVIIYSYVLSFPAGMRELIDIDAFKRDFIPQGAVLREDAKHLLNGLMRYRLTYL